MEKDWLDAIQTFLYNEGTGEFHDHVGTHSCKTDGWKVLCNSTERIYEPFYNFAHRLYDFSRVDGGEKEGIFPRPSLKELHRLWDSYLMLIRELSVIMNQNESVGYGKSS